MSMKTADAPRRIYVRNRIMHVCFSGKTFGPAKGTTALNKEKPVTIEFTRPYAGKPRVIVSQGSTSETWNVVEVPTNARTVAA